MPMFHVDSDKSGAGGQREEYEPVYPVLCFCSSSDSSSLECSLSAEYTFGSHAHHRSGSNGSARPFAMDLDVSSNRSSIISQEETEDEHH